MDYTTAPRSFQIRKAVRYARLYGVRRTAAKIRGEYHFQGEADGTRSLADDGGGHVGLIGCGRFAYSTIAYYLHARPGRVLRGAMDVDARRARSLARRYRLRYSTDDAARVLDDPRIDLVYIASDHASHAEYAIEALRRGRCVHIEKPHVVDRDQLARLCRAVAHSDARLRIGFNRPLGVLARQATQVLAEQAGPITLDFFVAGHDLPADHWYFDSRQGGRALGNLCHWTDFLYRLVAPEGRYPIQIQATAAVRGGSDSVVFYRFGDGSIGTITFSAKGHSFEGVRERFSAHRGDAIVAMDDFQRLRVDVGASRRVHRRWFRDQGHAAMLDASYRMSPSGGATDQGDDVRYVWETGDLFLATREALESERVVVLEGFDPALLSVPPPPR